jgi:hypothetical protein
LIIAVCALLLLCWGGQPTSAGNLQRKDLPLLASKAIYAWVFETVDVPKSFADLTGRSLRLDSSGYMHLAYGGNHLYYAAYAGGEAWRFHVADAAENVGRFAALVLDALKHPHISYYDAANGSLKYAHWNGKAWQITVVDEGGDVGQYTAIALTPAGRPCISYYDLTNSALKYACFNGITWTTQAVESAGEVGMFSSLAFDSGGRPHIAYYGGGRLKYATHTGTAWQITTVDPGYLVGLYASLALDGSGKMRIAYYDSGNQDLKYAAFNGTSWQLSTVDSAGNAGKHATLGLNTAGNPLIAYFVDGAFRLARFDGVNWQFETFADFGGAQEGLSLALDSAGRPALAALESPEVHVCKFNGSAWQTYRLDYAGAAGGYSSIVMDANDRPIISYCVGDCVYTKIAAFDGMEWRTTIVDQGGYHSKLVQDAGGGLHLSYVDLAAGSLRYARYDGKTWQTEVISASLYTPASSPTAQHHQSLALDSSGRPYITATSKGLILFHHDGTHWVHETLDSDICTASSLALDAANHAHISYYNLTDEAVRHIYQTGGGWVADDLLWLEGGPYSSATVLDPAGLPHVVYSHYNNAYWHDDLHYAHFNGLAWQDELVIDDDARVISLALDQEGLPQLVFPASHCYFMYKDSSGWHKKSLRFEAPGFVGTCETMSLALDSDDWAHISYGGTSLVYAHQPTQILFLPIAQTAPMGRLFGYVFNIPYGTKWEAVPGATVCVLDTGQCATSESGGGYSIEKILAGTHTVRVTAEGFLSQEVTVEIINMQTTYQDFSLVRDAGTVAGQVLSAVSGQGIAGAQVCHASGSPCTTSDGAGNYSLANLKTGPQTLRATANDFFPLEQSITVVPGQTVSMNFSLSPRLAPGEMRIVLTWGQDPSDLDSHLWLPASHKYHIYWNHRGDCNNDPYACLDVDDRTSYGPETITIVERFSGMYRFAVHRYAGTGSLTTSGARVQVYNDTGLVGDYPVPSSGSGDWWFVLEIDGNSGAITLRNIIQATSPAPY